jgi:hypothetical protein
VTARHAIVAGMSLSALEGPQPTWDRAIAERAAKQWGVVSRTDLLELGVTDKAIRVRLERGSLHRLYRGIYAVGHTRLTREGHLLAAVLACGPGAALSHRSAAILHEMLEPSAHPIEVTVRSRHRIPGIVVHHSERLDRTYCRGIPVTSRVRTIIDLNRTADEATVKRALRQARFGKAELERLPNRIIDLGTAPTRSPLEDEARDFVIAGGLRAPAEVNQPYRLSTRTVFPDLRWPELRLIVEVDSRKFHDDPLSRHDDALRQAELEALGERVIRITAADMRERPQQTLARLRAAGVPFA